MYYEKGQQLLSPLAKVNDYFIKNKGFEIIFTSIEETKVTNLISVPQDNGLYQIISVTHSLHENMNNQSSRTFIYAHIYVLMNHDSIEFDSLAVKYIGNNGVPYDIDEEFLVSFRNIEMITTSPLDTILDEVKNLDIRSNEYINALAIETEQIFESYNIGSWEVNANKRDMLNLIEDYSVNVNGTVKTVLDDYITHYQKSLVNEQGFREKIISNKYVYKRNENDKVYHIEVIFHKVSYGERVYIEETFQDDLKSQYAFITMKDNENVFYLEGMVYVGDRHLDMPVDTRHSMTYLTYLLRIKSCEEYMWDNYSELMTQLGFINKNDPVKKLLNQLTNGMVEFNQWLGERYVR